MWAPTPECIDASRGAAELDAALEALPNQPSVFLVWPREGPPYLGRTALLRRRLLRLLRERSEPSRLLNLRSVVSRVDYWFTSSRLQSSLLFYELARRYFPDSYEKLLKLRPPAYVKLIVSNQFPRTQVTTRLGGRSLFYGPFRTRAAAEHFESQFLDLFQLRRCQEDLVPSPDHPGCIYGEMNMCLRPCQQVVGPEEYATEVGRVTEFLSNDGRSLLNNVSASRDRLSEEMNFEEAARQHKRLERIQQVIKLRDELACHQDRMHGVAVAPSLQHGSVELWFLIDGCWQPPVRLGLTAAEGAAASLDQRLRQTAAALEPRKISALERQEHLAMLSRWFYSSWRDGEWIPFEDRRRIPYRKLVNAVHRIATAAQPH